VNIAQALDDPKVFAPFFRGPTGDAWRPMLAQLIEAERRRSLRCAIA
jgi:hypothetical protein